jgi:hypothetical protein
MPTPYPQDLATLRKRPFKQTSAVHTWERDATSMPLRRSSTVPEGSHLATGESTYH